VSEKEKLLLLRRMASFHIGQKKVFFAERKKITREAKSENYRTSLTQ